MRNRLMIVTAALLLASATLVKAQPAPAPKPAPEPTPTSPWTGVVDFGFRGTSYDGDAARAERYRDLRNGASSDILIGQENDQRILNFAARNIGYRDQLYTANGMTGKLNFGFAFDSTPLNYSYETLTPYTVTDQGALTLDSATRALVQAKKAVGVPCAPGAPPAACGNPTQAALALANRSIWNNLATPFDLTSLRKTIDGSIAYDATRNTSVDFAFATTQKTGHQPWGASFAFVNAVEVPKPLDNRTNDVSLGFEVARPKGMVRVAWNGSWFNNQIHDMTWDNPIFATDFNNGRTPPNGPWDPNGYNNGNGPARGREALEPDNTMMTFSGTALYKLSKRTVINGQLAFIDQKQNDTLIPWTINPLIAQPATYASFPGLAALPRNTAEAEVRAINAVVNFTTRPANNFSINAKYRLNRHDNQTPTFDASEYVRFDAVPEEGGGITEQFDLTRNTLDVNATWNVLPRNAIRFGFGIDSFNRGFIGPLSQDAIESGEQAARAYKTLTDNTFRASYDMYGNSFMTLRAQYEYTARRGSAFNEEVITSGGAQPGLRFYDDAERNRNRTSIIAVVSPSSFYDITASIAYNKDTYGLSGQEFGLLDAKVMSYNAGINFNPRPAVSFGLNYGYDKTTSLQESRNANPDCTLDNSCPPSGYNSWFDPNRNWSLDYGDKVNNFNLFLDLIKMLKNTDVRVSYDFENSDQNYTHGGPRIQEFATNSAFTSGDTRPCTTGVTSCFEALPNVTNSWNRFTFDVRYYFTKKVGIGLAYWYEKFDVTDFATIDDAGAAGGSVPFVGATGLPRIDYLGGLMLGYGNRPYTANTGFIRLLYTF